MGITITIIVTITALIHSIRTIHTIHTILSKEFHFDDAAKNQKLGADISLGFFAVGGIVAILIGYLADVTDRCLLLTCIVFLGEVSCLLTFFSRTYEELFLCRIFTGKSIHSIIIFSSTLHLHYIYIVISKIY